jgi:hypothetical protein
MLRPDLNLTLYFIRETPLFGISRLFAAFSRNFLLRVRRLRRSSSVLFGLERRLCFADKQFCSASGSTGIIASRRLRIPLVASAPLAVWDAWLKCAISTGFAQGIPPKALQNLRLLY